jgi:hypothetical protein
LESEAVKKMCDMNAVRGSVLIELGEGDVTREIDDMPVSSE